MGIEKHDDEGRLITVEYEDVYLVATYVPNSGQKLDRLDYRTKVCFFYCHNLFINNCYRNGMLICLNI